MPFKTSWSLKLLNNNKQVALIVGNLMTPVNPSTDMMVEFSVMVQTEKWVVKKWNMSTQKQNISEMLVLMLVLPWSRENDEGQPSKLFQRKWK